MDLSSLVLVNCFKAKSRQSVPGTSQGKRLLLFKEAPANNPTSPLKKYRKHGCAGVALPFIIPPLISSLLTLGDSFHQQAFPSTSGEHRHGRTLLVWQNQTWFLWWSQSHHTSFLDPPRQSGHSAYLKPPVWACKSRQQLFHSPRASGQESNACLSL